MNGIKLPRLQGSHFAHVPMAHGHIARGHIARGHIGQSANVAYGVPNA